MVTNQFWFARRRGGEVEKQRKEHGWRDRVKERENEPETAKRGPEMRAQQGRRGGARGKIQQGQVQGHDQVYGHNR